MQKTARNFFWQLSLTIALLGMGDQTGLAKSVRELVPGVIDGTNYAINLFEITYLPASGVDDGAYWGPLVSVTKDGQAVPFITLSAVGITSSDGTLFYPLLSYGFTVANVPPDAIFSQTYTLTWQEYVSNSVVVTNYTEDFILPINPYFLKQPQGQSAFAGSTVTLSASAIHISGYQWQKDGTNLVEDGHYIGVTNATLVITNAQLADAGQYAVVVSNPNATFTSTAASLAVYKPL